MHRGVWMPRCGAGGGGPAVRREGAPQDRLWPGPAVRGARLGLGGPCRRGDPLMCPLCPAVPSPESAGRCLKLRVSVCCRDTSECGWGVAAPQKSGDPPPLPLGQPGPC